MKLKYIKLRGAKGIKIGQGLDEIEINFENVNSGLIALIGENGGGKTTILENLHPFRCMASRAGSLQSHFFLKDSFRVIGFEMNGENYECKILIDALTGGSEAYLLKNGQPVNDGKLTTYDEEIEKLIGSQELFFNSVFSAQKSKGFAQLKPGERRTLFYELLNLNQYEGYCEIAKTNAKESELNLAKVEGEISSLKQSQGNLETLQGKLQEAELYETKLKSDSDLYKSNIQCLSDELVALRIENEKNKLIQTNNEQVAISIENATMVYNRESDIINKAISFGLSNIEDNKKIISRTKKIAENKDAIEAALLRKNKAQMLLQQLSNNVNKVHKQLNDLKDSHLKNKAKFDIENKELQAIQMERASLQNKLDLLTGNIERNEQDAKLIENVPCNVETGQKCKFLENAYNAKSINTSYKAERLELINKLDEKTKLQYEKKTSYQNNLQTENAQYESEKNAFESKLRLDETRMGKLNAVIAELNKSNWDALKQEATDAETSIKVCEEKEKNLNKEIKNKKAEYLQLTEKYNAELIKLSHSFNDEVAVNIIKIELDIAEQEKQLNNGKETLAWAEGEIKEAVSTVTELKQAITNYNEISLKLTKLEERKTAIEKDLLEWKILVKAFDKTGIPVLKLENSAVEITSLANELLSFFENKFRIVFNTTTLSRDKKKVKETFEINVIRENDVVEISNLSGGEQVWVETALQLAIALVVRKQGKNIETMFLDETDGALDTDNAYAYLQMIQRAHELSKVHNTFIITHRQELKELIPKKIILKDGYVKTITE